MEAYMCIYTNVHIAFQRHAECDANMEPETIVQSNCFGKRIMNIRAQLIMIRDSTNLQGLKSGARRRRNK